MAREEITDDTTAEKRIHRTSVQGNSQGTFIGLAELGKPYSAERDIGIDKANSLATFGGSVKFAQIKSSMQR